MSLEEFNFYTYISRLMKGSHPDHGLSGEASVVLNNMTKLIIYKICDTINLLSRNNKKNTILVKDLQTCIFLTFKPGMASSLNNSAMSHVSNYETNSKQKTDTAPVTRSYVAGLTYPVAKVENMMRKLVVVDRIGKSSPVYLAGVVQAVIKDILQESIEITKNQKKQRLTPKHITVALLNDSMGLKKFFKNSVIGGGVIPA